MLKTRRAAVYRTSGLSLLLLAALSGRFAVSNRHAVLAGDDVSRSAVVKVDPTRAWAGAEADVFGACGFALPDGGNAEAIGRWMPTDSRVDASSDLDDLAVYGAKAPDGFVVVMHNRGETRVSAQVRLQAPRGVYTVEHLCFDPRSPETSCSTDRLQSVTLTRPGALTKPAWLTPGQVSVYRYTNRAGQAAAAYRACRNCASAFSKSRPSEFRRIMAGLNECGSHLGAIASGGAGLKHIQRALLTEGFAEAVCRNMRSEGRLPGESGASLERGLANLNVALNELSGALLGLVPSVVVSPDTEAQTVTVTVSLTNGGTRTIPTVRLGAGAPSGANVQPAEEAFFKQLNPGQSVRATFEVRLGAAAVPGDITGTIAFYAERTPAHLRIQAL